MNTWFENLVSTLRSEIANTQELLEDPVRKAQVDAIIICERHHRNPQSLSARTLANELVKRIASSRFSAPNPFIYDELCPYLPPLKNIRDALYNSEIHQYVKIPPDLMVITDARLPVDEFSEILLEQVFESNVDQ